MPNTVYLGHDTMQPIADFEAVAVADRAHVFMCTWCAPSNLPMPYHHMSQSRSAFCSSNACCFVWGGARLHVTTCARASRVRLARHHFTSSAGWPSSPPPSRPCPWRPLSCRRSLPCPPSSASSSPPAAVLPAGFATTPAVTLQPAYLSPRHLQGTVEATRNRLRETSVARI